MERDAIDIEDVGGPALVASALFQDAQDVDALDFVQTLPGSSGRGGLRLENKILLPQLGSCATTIARSTAFSSSRTLPIHACCCNWFMAADEMRVMRLFMARANLRMKCSTRRGISSRRLRNGGSSIRKTLRR